MCSPMPDVPDEAWAEISDRMKAEGIPDTIAHAVCRHCEYVIRLTRRGVWCNLRTDAVPCGPNTLHSPAPGTLREVR